MKILCISGKAQHGKDTSAKILKEILQSDGNSVLIAHYADLVKYICKTFFDWNGEKDVYGRTLLQRVGTDVIRAQDEDYWVGFIGEMLTFFDGEWDYVIIPDCRFPNEVDYLRKAGFDLYHLRVIRNNFESPLTAEQQAHPSETALDNVKPDYLINNSGDENELKKVIESIVVESSGFRQMSLFGIEKGN